MKRVRAEKKTNNRVNVIRSETKDDTVSSIDNTAQPRSEAKADHISELENLRKLERILAKNDIIDEERLALKNFVKSYITSLEAPCKDNFKEEIRQAFDIVMRLGASSKIAIDYKQKLEAASKNIAIKEEDFKEQKDQYIEMAKDIERKKEDLKSQAESKQVTKDQKPIDLSEKYKLELRGLEIVIGYLDQIIQKQEETEEELEIKHCLKTQLNIDFDELKSLLEQTKVLKKEFFNSPIDLNDIQHKIKERDRSGLFEKQAEIGEKSLEKLLKEMTEHLSLESKIRLEKLMNIINIELHRFKSHAQFENKRQQIKEVKESSEEDKFAAIFEIDQDEAKENGFSDIEEFLSQANLVRRYSKKDHQTLNEAYVTFVTEWAQEKRGKLGKTDEDICEAIVVMNVAYWLLTSNQFRNTQIIATLLFLEDENQGKLCQINTGEGKTTIVSMLAVIKVLQGYKVDVITSNIVLAKEGVGDKEDFYGLFGISVAHNEDSKGGYTDGPKVCYTSGVVYGDIGNFQFDYLRDHFECQKTFGNRKFEETWAILDEVDSMLVDNGGHIAKLAEPFPGYDRLRYVYIKIWQELKKAKAEEEDNIKKLMTAQQKKSKELSNEAVVQDSEEKMFSDFDQLLFEQIEELKHTEVDNVRRKIKQSFIPGEILLKISDGKPVYLERYAQEMLSKWIENALIAQYTYKVNHQYKIKKDEQTKELSVVPIDNHNTGVTLTNTILSYGIHQFLQLKHNLALTFESLTSSYVSNIGYIRLYGSKLLGLTGTLGSEKEQELLSSAYKINYGKIPTYKTKKFKPWKDAVIADEDFMDELAIQTIKIAREPVKRAVLVICATVHDLINLDNTIRKIAIVVGLSEPRIRLYADEECVSVTEEELDIGDIVLSTNIGGRGTDLKTSGELNKNGGLHVIVAFLPLNQRVEDQATGRTSRQGKEGSAQLFIRGSEVNNLYAQASGMQVTQNNKAISTNKVLLDRKYDADYEEGLRDLNELRIDEVENSITSLSKDLELTDLQFLNEKGIDNIRLIKKLRDDLEINRLSQIIQYKLQELDFQDKIFKEFLALYTPLKKRNDPEHGGQYKKERESVLKDLKEKWACWCEANKFDASRSSNSDITLLAQTKFKEFEREACDIINSFNQGYDIKHNLYYAIEQVDQYIIDENYEKAKEVLRRIEEECDGYASNIRLFEISIQETKPVENRFWQAMGNLFDGHQVESSNFQKKESLSYLNKAQAAIKPEIEYLQNILGVCEKQAGISEDFQRILVNNEAYHEKVDSNLKKSSMDYWYSDDDMDRLGQRLAKYGINIEKQFKGRLTQDVIDSLPAAEDRPDEEVAIIQGLEEGKPIFIAYNIGGSAATNGGLHWVAIVLVKYDGRVKVLYKDSKGDLDNAAIIKDAFLAHYGPAMDFIENIVAEQEDGSSCGPMTINNLEIMADVLQKKLAVENEEFFIGEEEFYKIQFTKQKQVQALRNEYLKFLEYDREREGTDSKSNKPEEHKTKENYLIKHLLGRLQCLQTYSNTIDGLKEEVRNPKQFDPNGQEFKPAAANSKIAISTKDIEFLSKLKSGDQKESLPPLLDISEMGSKGYDVGYMIKPIRPFSETVLTASLAQIGGGIAVVLLGLALPFLMPIMGPLGGTLIGTGILDLIMEALQDGSMPFNHEAYNQSKAITYSIAAATMGIGVLAMSSKILQACKSICEGIAKGIENLATKIPFLKDALQVIANQFWKLAVFFSDKIEALGKTMEASKYLINVVKSVGTDLAFAGIDEGLSFCVGEIINQFATNIKDDVARTIEQKIDKAQLSLHSQETIMKITNEILKGDFGTKIGRAVGTSVATHGANWKIKGLSAVIGAGIDIGKMCNLAEDFCNEFNERISQQALEESNGAGSHDAKINVIIDQVSSALQGTAIGFTSNAIMTMGSIAYQRYKENKDRVRIEEKIKELKAQQEPAVAQKNIEVSNRINTLNKELEKINKPKTTYEDAVDSISPDKPADLFNFMVEASMASAPVQIDHELQMLPVDHSGNGIPKPKSAIQQDIIGGITVTPDSQGQFGNDLFDSDNNFNKVAAQKNIRVQREVNPDGTGHFIPGFRREDGSVDFELGKKHMIPGNDQACLARSMLAIKEFDRIVKDNPHVDRDLAAGQAAAFAADQRNIDQHFVDLREHASNNAKLKQQFEASIYREKLQREDLVGGGNSNRVKRIEDLDFRIQELKDLKKKPDHERNGKNSKDIQKEIGELQNQRDELQKQRDGARKKNEAKISSKQQAQQKLQSKTSDTSQLNPIEEARINSNNFQGIKTIIDNTQGLPTKTKQDFIELDAKTYRLEPGNNKLTYEIQLNGIIGKRTTVAVVSYTKEFQRAAGNQFERMILNALYESLISGVGKKLDITEHRNAGAINREIVNIEYWLNYQEQFLPYLLELRLQSIDIGICNKISIAVPMVIDFTDYKQQLSSLNENIADFYSSGSHVHYALLPILVLQSALVYHWVGIVVEKSDNGMLWISYLDSENGVIVEELEKELMSELHIFYPDNEVLFRQILLEQQRYNNCGPELIESFIYYLTGTRATQESAPYVHSLLLENSLLDPREYELKIAENNQVIAQLSNQVLLMYRMTANLGVDRDANRLLAMPTQQIGERFEISTLATKVYLNELLLSDTQYLNLKRFDYAKQVSMHQTIIMPKDLVLLEVGNEINFSQGDTIAYMQNIIPTILAMQSGYSVVGSTALVAMANRGYDVFGQPSQDQRSDFFTFIDRFGDTITSTLSNGLMNTGGVIINIIMKNNYIEYQLMNYVYHKELSAINTVINKPYIQLSEKPDIKLLLKKHPLEWNKNDFKKIKLVVHPDKGGNNEDFHVVNTFQEQTGDKQQVYQNFLSKLLPNIQTLIHKSNIGFKVLDTVIDSGRLIYEPTFQSAKKVTLDSTYLYSMYSGVNSFSVVITGSEAIYQAYQGEYTQAFKAVSTTIAYMALPSLLAYTAIPHVGLVYGIGMATYTGYSAITNAYSFYLERSSDTESALRSTMAYRDLAQTLSESPLQQLYDFAALAQEYKLGLNHVALVTEKEALKAKLVDEKGEFGHKLYDYIYKALLEEKYDLLNQVLQGSITKEDVEILKAKHISITLDKQSYQHCMQMKDIENISDGNEDTNKEHYYCYNQEQQILDHIVIGESRGYFEILERL
jgi:preprotein translocase subunit SecA